MAWLKSVYVGTAIITDTGKHGKVSAVAKSYDTAIEMLKAAGYTAPFNITVQPVSPPTAKQIALCTKLNITIPAGADIADVSVIIDRHNNRDTHYPPPGLVSYLTAKEIEFSPYIGNNSLWLLAFNKLELIDRITFFIYSIYLWRTRSTFNLGTHPDITFFINTAKYLSSDKKFLDSMNKYSGDQLQAFGQYIVNGVGQYGSSDRTYAYTTAFRLLKSYYPALQNKPSPPRQTIPKSPANPVYSKTPYSYISDKIYIALFIVLIFIIGYIISVIRQANQ
jgi:hypothetical protein